MRIVPSTRRYRRVRQITIDQHPGRTLQATMDQCHRQPVAAKKNALVGLLRQQVLVGGGELRGEDQRGLGRFERVAGQRVRGPRKMPLELRP